jgi:hypothetical protein
MLYDFQRLAMSLEVSIPKVSVVLKTIERDRV